MKRTTIRSILITLGLTALVVVTYLTAVDMAAAYESTEATPCPPAVVAKVRAAHKVAVAAWRADTRARSCFTRRAWARPASLPARAESEAAWREALSHYRSLTHQYRAELKRLRHAMTHPGGSSNGVRWKPLARWVGWPEYALGELTMIIYRESSGRERACSYANCRGLMQLHPGFWTGAWPIRGVREAFDAYDAETNLRKAYGLWRDQHGSFLPAWGL